MLDRFPGQGVEIGDDFRGEKGLCPVASNLIGVPKGVDSQE